MRNKERKCSNILFVREATVPVSDANAVSLSPHGNTARGITVSGSTELLESKGLSLFI